LPSREAQACALEASSIGIAEGRLDGARIDIAVFTNLTRDHLDYHRNMAEYAQAKAKLFTWPRLRLAVVNLDDPFGRELAALSSAAKVVGYTQQGIAQ
jgi:UDP-N-acetylmuramyl tripeptide synthase